MTGLGHRRLRLILALSTIAFAVVVLRAVQIQGFDAASLTAKAAAQQSTLASVPGLRGTIFDRYHRPLAQDQPAVTVMADQPLIKDPQGTAVAIAQQLGYSYPPLVQMPKQKLKKKQLKATQHWVTHKNKKRKHLRALYTAKVKALTGELTGTFQYQTVNDAARISPKLGKKIMAQKLVGISLLPTSVRYYPQDTTAAQLVGFTDQDGNGRYGAGLEHLLNPVLASHAGEEATVSAPGSDSAIENIVVKPPVNGRNVTLTIDSNVQQEAERVLGETVSRYGAHSATAIVMDPRSGALLAVASAPGYNNNIVHQVLGGATPWITNDSAVQNVYEPGSVFKVVTFSAALTRNQITPTTVFQNLPAELHYPPDYTITDAEARGPETFTASRILAESSNIGTDTIARLVGKNPLQRWIYRYGFGHATALGLPGESPGIVLPAKQWTGSSIGTIPIGQGVSVTAVQMADAYAAIANGGVMPEPHVIQSVAGRKPAKLHPRRVLSPRVDKQLVGMLGGVVNEPLGTGVLAQIPGYSVAGKTGTAEKPSPDGGYIKGKYVSSFVGFFPAHNPQVEIMVVVDSPSNGLFGGTVAAPAFAKIGCWYAHTYNITPDKGKATACPSS